MGCPFRLHDILCGSHQGYLLVPTPQRDAAVAVPRDCLAQRGELSAAVSAAEHSRPSGWPDRESELPVKVSHAFCCHEPGKASWERVLVQVPHNGLHQALPEPSALKSRQHDHVLKVEIQCAVPDHPRAPDDVAFVQGADREQGAGQASLGQVLVQPSPAGRFTQGEVLADCRDTLNDLETLLICITLIRLHASCSVAVLEMGQDVLPVCGLSDGDIDADPGAVAAGIGEGGQTR